MTAGQTMTSKAVPKPTPETQVYWDMAAKHELWLPRCVDTGKFFFPPQESSPLTGGRIEWARVSGRGRLASYVITRMAAPGFEAELPYVVALVELEEGPRLTSNLRNVAPDPAALKIGMPLRVVFEQRDLMTLPQFAPLEEP
jgi:uncharacterized OB-fold protein